MARKTPCRRLLPFYSRRNLLVASIILFCLATLYIRHVDPMSPFVCRSSYSVPADSTSQPDMTQEQSTLSNDEDIQKNVILLTYGRSGSTLTADIVQRHQDVFFNFEPLLNLAKTFTKMQDKYAAHNNGAHLHLVTIPEYIRKAEKLLESLLTCNFTTLPKEGYNNVHLIRARETAMLAKCIKAASNNNDIQACLVLHSAICKNMPIQFIKTIRLSVESVGRLMEKNPRLKMIFLLRDPRGSFLSKKKIFRSSMSTNATYEADRYCVRLVKDVREAFRLHGQFPGRVLMTTYESIAADPISTSRQLYSFLRLNFTSDIAAHINDNMKSHDEAKNKDPFSSSRRNSTAVSYAWRSSITYADAKEFDVQCKYVYKKMGYLPVKSEDHLRDLSTPIKVKVDLVT